MLHIFKDIILSRADELVPQFGLPGCKLHLVMQRVAALLLQATVHSDGRCCAGGAAHRLWWLLQWSQVLDLFNVYFEHGRKTCDVSALLEGREIGFNIVSMY